MNDRAAEAPDSRIRPDATENATEQLAASTPAQFPALEGDSRIRESALPDRGFAEDRPTGPRTVRGHALARNLRDRDGEVDWDAWVRDIETEAAALDEERLARAIHAAACIGDETHRWTVLHHATDAATIANALRAARATPAIEPGIDELDAWSEAEAALPDRWYFNVGSRGHDGYRVSCYRVTDDTDEWWGAGIGPTPAAALRALTEKLRATPADRERPE